MSLPFSQLRNSRLLPVFTLIAIALPYFINLGTSSLWDASESFYAETAREMLETGDFVAPHFNYEIRAQKPPLTYWVIALSYKLFGVSEFAVRLPGALAASGLLLFTYGLGRRIFSPFAAILGVMILGTTARVFLLARKLPIDMFLLLWLTGTAYYLVRATQESKPSWRSWLPLYILLALGFMTKGPVAWVIPFGTYILWSLIAPRSLSLPPRPMAGSAVLACIVLPWYVLIYLSHGWKYITPFFLKDNLARFAGESFGPSRGPFYYIPTYLADFFPWSILSLAALFYVFTHRNALRKMNQQLLFVIIWCGLTFVLFTFSKNKQEYYIAPIYPMMAVILGGVLERPKQLFSSRESTESAFPWLWPFFAAMLLLAGAAVLILILIPAILPGSPIIVRYGPPAVLLTGAGLLAWQVIRSNLWGSFATLMLSVWLLFILGSTYMIPAVEHLRPVKEMCRVLDREARPGDQVGYYLASVPSMAYYLRRPIFEEYDKESMFRRFKGETRTFCLLTEHDYNYFVGTRDLILYVIDRRPRLVTQVRAMFDEQSWIGQELLLVSNRPNAEPGTREVREIP